MYEIEIEKEFSAAHFLRGYPGDCSNVHGHNWVVTAVVRAEALDDLGMAVDFRTLRGALDGVLDTLDHAFLNELEPFSERNPTSENIARYIFDELSRAVDSEAVAVAKVSVRESPGATATYAASK